MYIICALNISPYHLEHPTYFPYFFVVLIYFNNVIWKYLRHYNIFPLIISIIHFIKLFGPVALFALYCCVIFLYFSLHLFKFFVIFFDAPPKASFKAFLFLCLPVVCIIYIYKDILYIFIYKVKSILFFSNKKLKKKESSGRPAE